MKNDTYPCLALGSLQDGSPWAFAVLVASVVSVGALGGCDGATESSSSHARAPDAGGADAASVAERDASLDARVPTAQTGTLVTLAAGAVQGKLIGATRAFLGIPYAKAPVGALRFAPPQPAAAWSDTRDATAFGPACPQGAGAATANGVDEDCLSLNIFTPATLENEPLPVMVYIHGGGFNGGSSNQSDAQSLSEAGPVVVVTINYRVGALGFLSLPELDAQRPMDPSGSDGIRDQQLALRWVRDNIAVFGGDGHNVTLFGQSAGARSACVHLAAPSSRGLAQRFILESGVCFGGPLALPSKAEATAMSMRLVTELCAGATDVVQCLSQLPADALATWGNNLSLIGPGWGPPVGGDARSVLPDAPATLIRMSDEPVAVIVGANLREWGTFQLLGSPKTNTLTNFKAAIAKHFGDHADAVAARYTPKSDSEANDTYVRLVTDLAWRCPTRSLARTLTDRAVNVRVYSFEQGLAYHGSELDYVFGGSTPTPLRGLESTPQSQAVTQAIQHYWTRFAATGDPNDSTSANWPRYESDAESYLALVAPAKAVFAPLSDACDFWSDYAHSGGHVVDLFSR